MQPFLIAALAALAIAAPLETRKTDAPYGNKKGIAWSQDASLTTPFTSIFSVGWSYDWGSTGSAGPSQYIPMCWDKNCDSNAVLAKVKAGAPWVLGYNEPDQCGQGGSCMPVGDVASSWPGKMLPFKQAGAKLVCPAVTSTEGDANKGLAYLGSLVKAAGAAKLGCDAQALHWYGNPAQTPEQQADLFTAYVQKAREQVKGFYGKDMDLWITEFAPLPMQPDVMARFLAKVVPWLDSQDYVARYSPFMASYMVTGGKLNAGGMAFVNGKSF